MDGKFNWRKLDSVPRLGDEDLQVKMCACMLLGLKLAMILSTGVGEQARD